METVEILISTSLKDEVSTACAWDVCNGTLLARYRGGGSCSPHGLSSSGGYILSCEKRKPMLHLWQYNKQHCENNRLVAPGKVNVVAFSPDSVHIALAIDEKIHLYQTACGRLLGIGSKHFQPITVMKFSDDSTLLCCGGEDGLVTVWNLSVLCKNDGNAEPILTFSDHSLPITDLIFSSGNIRSRVISISMDRTCKIYDLLSGKTLLSLVFEHPLSSVALSPVETEIYVGNSEGYIQEYSLTAPPRMLEHHITQDDKNPVFNGHEKTVSCLACTVDCRHIISGSLDETIKIWHISSRQCLRTIPQKGPVTNILYMLLPKSVFSHTFKPSAFVNNFINPANVDNDEESTFEIMVTEDLMLQEPIEKESRSLTTNSENTDSLKEEINKLKSINNTMYKFTVSNILNKKPLDTSEATKKKRKKKHVEN